MEKLAIVIPAYKGTYFSEALESIARQTNRAFKVYIGDDASPYRMEKVVDRFRDRFELVYRRFPENLGGRDLVAQWERCAELVEDEDWIWFFSDDDVMGEDCVEVFHRARATAAAPVEVYHFDLKIIDPYGAVTHTCPPYPERLSAADFFKGIYTHRLDARMPDFLFAREAFLRLGRFQSFDLAFRTDNATILKLSYEHGIETLPGAVVYWRNSEESVSSSRSKDLIARKARATIAFLNWIETFFRAKGAPCPLSAMARLRIVIGNLWPLARHFGLAAAYAELGKVDQLQDRPLRTLYSKAYLALCKTRLKKAPRRY